MNKKVDTTYIPVQMFVRISRTEGEAKERAILVARREDGRQFIFSYDCLNEESLNLSVHDFDPENDENYKKI